MSASINHLEARHSQMYVHHSQYPCFLCLLIIIFLILLTNSFVYLCCSTPQFPYRQSKPKLLRNALFWAVHRVENTKKRKATKREVSLLRGNVNMHKQNPRLQQIKCQFCDKLIHHFNWVWIANAQLLLKHGTNLHFFNHQIF